MKKAVISGSAIVVILIAAVILTSLSSGDQEESPLFTDAAISATQVPTPSVTAAPDSSVTSTATPVSNGSLVLSPSYFPPRVVSLNLGKGGRFILSDGSSINIKLVGTRLLYGTEGSTVWSTATIEVTAPGQDPVTKELPVAYFSRPWVIGNARIWVAMTANFNDGRLRDGGSTTADARIVLADARLPLTDPTEFIWPYGDLIWQEGSKNVYYQGLGGTLGETAFHHGAIDIGMPRGTPVYAWRDGIVQFEDRSFDFLVKLTGSTTQLFSDMSILHLESVVPELDNQFVKKGTLLGYSGQATWYHTHVAYDYTLGPALAEWYTEGASPELLSYARTWLVAGPFFNTDDRFRPVTDYLGEEALAMPELGQEAADGRDWRYWDNIVPGVVMVGSAISPFPYSNFSDVSGNYSIGAAYLGTYVYAPESMQAVMRVGGSDSIAVWVGDKQILSTEGCVGGDVYGETPTIYVDQYQEKVSLEAGWNRVLIKTVQRAGCPESWQISLRFSDDTGMVIDGLIVDALKGAPAPDIQAVPDEKQLAIVGITLDDLGNVDAPLPPILANMPSTKFPTYPTPTAVPTPTVDINELIKQGIEVHPISRSIPGNLPRESTPVFLVLGSDDNHQAKGINWFVNDLLAGRSNPAGSGNPATFDGTPANMSFYIMGVLEGYGSGVASAIRNAYDKGNEIGNHGYGGFDGGLTSQAAWRDSISRTNAFLTRPIGGDGTTITSSGGQTATATGIGIPAEHILGYRTPLDQYNDDLFAVLSEMGFLYHSSSAQGHTSQSVDGGSDLYWPGTLENGIPYANPQAGVANIPNTPGLWELSQNYLRIPESLGGGNLSYCDKLWFHTYRDDPPDAMADKVIEILKYNLDLHIQGNRTPLHVCLHSQEWDQNDWESGPRSASTLARQRILTEFLDYAATKPEVRIVTQAELIDWVRNPVPIQ